MVFNWDTDGSGNARNLMLPVQSPYYFTVFDSENKPFLWYAHVKGEVVGKWVDNKVAHQLIKMNDFKKTQMTLNLLVKAGDLPRIIKDLKRPSGNYTVSMIYFRGDEVAATYPIFVE